MVAGFLPPAKLGVDPGRGELGKDRWIQQQEVHAKTCVAFERRSDARDDEAQLQQNQADLAVNEDHKTDEMEDAGRGTFP